MLTQSPRLDGLDLDHVRVLAEVQVPLPPILVHRDTMRIIDGGHRVAAAKLRGDTTIRARLFDGTDFDAFVLAVRSNIQHGLPLTHDDRVAAAGAIVRSHPHWSDRAVAATAGLSATTVAYIRRRVNPDCPPEEKRTGVDGRCRPVDPRVAQERVREVILQSPHKSLRQLAREAGVAPNTVRRVREQLRLLGTSPDTADHQRAEQSEQVPQQRTHQEPVGPGEGDAADLPASAVDPAPLPTSAVDIVLRRLTKDPSLRLTQTGRVAIRWFLSRAVRPGEWESVVDELPPHTTFLLAQVAHECASTWGALAERLAARSQQAD